MYNSKPVFWSLQVCQSVRIFLCSSSVLPVTAFDIPCSVITSYDKSCRVMLIVYHFPALSSTHSSLLSAELMCYQVLLPLMGLA